MKFGMQDKLKGVTSTIKAVVNNTKTKAVFKGTLEFDWSDVTLQQVLDAFAAPDRKITWANTHRAKIGEYKNKKTVHVKVSPPGTRVSVKEPVTLMDVETYLASLTPERLAEVVALQADTRKKA